MESENSSPLRLRETPSWLIGRAASTAHRILASAFAAADSYGYAYRLLAALEEFGPASQATLGRRTAMDRSDVAGALNDLERRGFVERAPDPSDRRRNVITITPSGRRHLRRLDEIVADAQQQLLAPLTRAERRQLREFLVRVLEHHGNS